MYWKTILDLLRKRFPNNQEEYDRYHKIFLTKKPTQYPSIIRILKDAVQVDKEEMNIAKTQFKEELNSHEQEMNKAEQEELEEQV
jgi:hypothetical protein